MDTSEIEKLAAWSAAREVPTKHGRRLLRKADPTEAFRDAWHKDAAALRAAGCSMSEWRGKWELAWWQPLPAGEQAARLEAVAASRATDAAVDLICPPGLAYMPFQKAGIAYGLAHPNVLIADEMGLGKTIQAIGIINNDPAVTSALVICPKSVKLNWARECQKWLARPMTVGVSNGTWPATDIVIVNYEGLKKYHARAMERHWGAVIVDEAHYIKNAKTQRSIAIKGQRARAARGNKPAVEAIPGLTSDRKIRLTGTPIVNRPVELQNLVDDLDAAFAGFGYLKRFTDAKQIYAGRRAGYVWDFSGAAHLDELQRLLRERVMIRRLKADVLTELPAKIRSIIELEPDDETLQDLCAQTRAFEAKYELGGLQDDDYAARVAWLMDDQSGAGFTELSALRHATARAKVPQVIDHLHTILDDDETRKVIVAAHHHDVIQNIRAACHEAGWGAVTLTGGDNDKARQTAVDTFQSDPQTRVFIGSIQAAGVGITLTAASIVVFAELDWVPGNVSQMEDRAHRIGQKDTVLVQHLIVVGTIDAKMVKTIVRKQAIIERALDAQTPEPVAPAAVEPKPAVSEKVETPVTPAAVEPKPAAKEEPALTAEQTAAVQTALRILAGLDDDYASVRNGQGFNKYDGEFGHDLAARSSLSPRQAAAGRKLVRKYRRQLPADLLEAMGL